MISTTATAFTSSVTNQHLALTRTKHFKKNRSHSSIVCDTLLFQSQNNNDTNDKANIVDTVVDLKSNNNIDEMKTPSSSSTSSSLGPAKKVVRNVTFAISSLWNYVIMFFGVAFSLGLVLNLLGYAYIIGDNGLEIDTIGNMRAKQQFRSAEIQIMKNDGK